MKKHTWRIHGIAECDDCDFHYENYLNCQAVAAKHAKQKGHKVHGEVGLAFKYDGRAP